MTDQLEVRTLATQLIRNAIKEIDSEVACDHVVATLGEDVDVDALAFGSEAAVREAQIGISWDGYTDTTSTPDPRFGPLLDLTQGLMLKYSELASNVAAHLPDDVRAELIDHTQTLLQEARDRFAEIAAMDAPQTPTS